MTLQAQLQELKRRYHAVILAHNYTLPEVQDVADFTGDSLALSIKARDARAEVMLFAGVRFMAETAKILAPASTVLLPVADAGCPMADMAPAEKIRAYRAAHPDAILVAYVNTTAAAKAEVDICCTSANAVRVVNSLPPGRPVMFLPDRNLGANVMALTGRKLELWDGCCPVHDRVVAAAVTAARAAEPGAAAMVHPECRPAVCAAAGQALSTGQMLERVRECPEKTIIIGTEQGILHPLRRDHPDKRFVPLEPPIICADMKKITLADLVRALQDQEEKIELPAEVIARARQPIERMLALG